MFVFLDQMITRNGGEIKKFASETALRVRRRGKDRRKNMLHTIRSSTTFRKVGGPGSPL